MAAVQTLRRSPAPPALAPSASYDDADLDAAALKLDEHSRLLRADMLAQLLDCKRKLGERQQAAAAAAAAQGASQLAAKQQQVDAASAELARQREIVRRTGTVLFKAARWRRQLSLGCRSWRAWRAYVRRQRSLKARVQAATEHYEVMAQAASAVEAERQRITQEAQQLAAQHAQRLAEVEQQLAAALEARAVLEADTKRAFMRGVCALNLEVSLQWR
ncbi:hypothetical protein CHLNCDRAFT_139452 [Chlorella variabilis]|uniref:Centrosomal protein POC5 n=1 Tax=Chlorella variabilis TaxID=554065 RepID=E1ZQ64_CHLVA|nr:hypothetical protein CHLNCDRAFT_139452 [Chlorella variabilis]EFN51964.1 hypothetical protein CHLNCDRAFT_139452 [Chlorella variabilis]|eukprot:XP_005844066.1 hypothetical protein CHLNCDRAFT_139452 [Chlorella variabilis]